MIERAAIISPCTRYRYQLSRSWGDGDPICTFIMLNPSTADANQDDPTIRRCIDFCRRWKYSHLIVVNLFAYRSTDPLQLGVVPDPVGPDNDRYIHAATVFSKLIVAAWGTPGDLLGRDRQVMDQLAGIKVKCLGLTKHGHPRHPLYTPAAAPLIDFSVKQ